MTRASETASRLRGTIGFPVTPFETSDGQPIDWPAFREHVDAMAGSGLSAVVVAGGTGELFSLRRDEVVRLAREAVEVVAGRTVVVVGVGSGAAHGGELAIAARDAGADAVLVLPPYYPTPDREGLVAYYAQIAAAVPELAVVPYSRGAARITPDVLERLAAAPNVTAFKDGHGDVRTFLLNRRALGDRYVWLAGTGDDLVGPYAAAGAEGYTSSIACFDPALSLELWRLAAGGRFAELDALSERMVHPWYELRTRRPGYEVSVMKGAMEAFGARAGSVRPPLAPLTAEDAEEVRRIARAVGRL